MVRIRRCTTEHCLLRPQMRPLRPITPPPKPAAMVRANSASDGRSFGQKNSKPQMPATSSPTDRLRPSERLLKVCWRIFYPFALLR